MKKIIALSLMVLMVFTMAIPMFAVYEEESDFDSVAFEIKKADMEIKLDGDLSEFKKMHTIKTKKKWMTYNTSTKEQMTEVKSINTPLYMAWDETYLYIATSYKPKTFSNTKEDDLYYIWQETAIQVNVSSENAKGEDRLEFGVALSSETKKQLSYVWANRDGFDYDPTDNFFVTRSWGTVTYEVRIPWTDFLKATPEEGDVIKFCIVWAMGVGDHHAHKQLAAGCTGDLGKSAEYFAEVTLGAAPKRPIKN